MNSWVELETRSDLYACNIILCFWDYFAKVNMNY